MKKNECSEVDEIAQEIEAIEKSCELIHRRLKKLKSGYRRKREQVAKE